MACSTTPVPSDSESVSSSSSCDSFEYNTRPILQYSSFYTVDFKWQTYDHFHDAGVAVEELCADILHCFAKHIIVQGLPNNVNYWVNAVNHYREEGLLIFFSIGGPFPKGGPINAAERLTNLLQNAFLDYAAAKGLDIDAMKVQEIKVSKIATEFESVASRLEKDEQRSTTA